jgi:hypothetical protein
MIDRIQADRALIISGQFDPPRIKTFISSLGAANPNIALETVAWSGHGGYMFRPAVVRHVVDWLGGDASRLQTRSRLLLLLALFGCSFALAVVVLPTHQKRLRENVEGLARAEIKSIVLWYVAAGMAAFALGSVGSVMAWIRLYATDYLMSFILVAGGVLWMRRPSITFTRIGLFGTLLAAAWFVAVPGIVAGSHFAHLTLTDGRWWRFAAIAAASFPLLLADETYIRPLYPWWKAAGVAILTRMVFAGLIATGVLIFNRGAGLIILIIPLVFLFWILLWFAGAAVRRRTESPAAAALLTALIQGWVFAAIFIMK